MNYLTTMGNLLSFTPFSWETEKEIKQLQFYCIVNVLVLGLIYGCSAALFSKLVLVEKGFDAQAVNVAKIIIAGIPVAFFMHAGAALFIWVFLKAMGGKANFMISYFHIGAAAISLWPLAPFVAVLQIGMSSPLLILLTGLFCLYAFAVNVKVIKSAFGLSALRMTLATSVTIMYISCFLYLWV
ncbi:MAG: hypothetical protein MI892_00045 [Desulfobacterales bacterium]|nr:hypothetical protein [Desulfobacterales bacterium]